MLSKKRTTRSQPHISNQYSCRQTSVVATLNIFIVRGAVKFAVPNCKVFYAAARDNRHCKPRPSCKFMVEALMSLNSDNINESGVTPFLTFKVHNLTSVPKYFYINLKTIYVKLCKRPIFHKVSKNVIPMFCFRRE